jgi:L-threonylcarbamoyladenylate synthase
MTTDILAISSRHPEPDAIARAADVLRRGGLVAFPTETVYGLGANALNAGAVSRIFAAKGRPPTNPLIVHVADAAGARSVVSTWPDTATYLAERFWPGPLTLVLPRTAFVPDVVTASGPTVAVRVPAHPVAQALLRSTGFPLAAPSANASNYVSPTQAEHVRHDLDGRIDLILDGGPTPGGLESTVLDLTSSPPRLLRPGLVTAAELELVLGPIAQASESPAAAPLPSPGMLRRHYAPRAALECVVGGQDRVEALCREGRRVGWLAIDSPALPQLPGLTVVPMSRDPAEYAACLYAALHELDALGVEHIVVSLPPHGDAWLAIHDRLRRASTAG